MKRRWRVEGVLGVIYPVLLIAGFAGLVVMLLLGFAHGPGHGHHGRGPVGQLHTGRGHGNAAGHGHAAQGHSHAHGGHAHGGQHDNANADGDSDADVASGPGNALVWLMPFLSPLNWFSWLLGAGAAGTLARMVGLHEPMAAGAALGGALALNLGVVKPIWRLVFRFASEPAGNLESCLLQQVEAVTAFNARGEGLVRVTIDGRSDDVLATLVDAERGSGARVRRGDRLLIEDVDPRANSCRVSRV
jgi:hypothetical protein